MGSAAQPAVGQMGRAAQSPCPACHPLRPLPQSPALLAYAHTNRSISVSIHDSVTFVRQRYTLTSNVVTEAI